MDAEVQEGPLQLEATSVNSVLQHVDINGLGYGQHRYDRWY